MRLARLERLGRLERFPAGLERVRLGGSAPAPAPGPVTAYYSSPGTSGSYLQASTPVAAHVLFPGVSQTPPWTVAFWLERPDAGLLGAAIIDCNEIAGPVYFRVSASSPAVDDFIQAALAGGGSAVLFEAYPSMVTATHLAWTFDGTTLRHLRDGSLISSEVSDTPPFDWPGSASEFWLLSQVDGGYSVDGDIRAIMLHDRAITADEVADLYAAGPTHNPLLAAGTHWAASQSIPVVWCTAAVAGAVANSGSAGACDLVLNGDVTSEVDP